MSIKTWEEEFYPIDVEGNPIMDPLEATKNCLQSWIGLRKENLEKHDLVKNMSSKMICEKKNSEIKFFKDDTKCALCVMTFNLPYTPDNECSVYCPLFRVIGNMCDKGYGSPYLTWVHTGNPEPMIYALEKTIEMIETDNKLEKE